MKLLDFIFGKSPDIFDSKGGVLHKLPDDRWKQWHDRFQKAREYDWRTHRGTERKITSAPVPKPAPQAPAAAQPAAGNVSPNSQQSKK